MIKMRETFCLKLLSLPSRERGLKSLWDGPNTVKAIRRSLRGSED